MPEKFLCTSPHAWGVGDTIEKAKFYCRHNDSIDYAVVFDYPYYEEVGIVGHSEITGPDFPAGTNQIRHMVWGSRKFLAHMKTKKDNYNGFTFEECADKECTCRAVSGRDCPDTLINKMLKRSQ